MHDGNPVHIHTGRYPRGIDVSNFKWKFEYFVPEERFSGGEVQIWRPFVSYLYAWYTYLRETNKLSDIQLCGKTGVNREKVGSRIHVFKGKTISEIQLCGKRGDNQEKGGSEVECLWFSMQCVCSSIFIWKPLISLLFLIRRAIISTDWTKNRADKGYPWRFRTIFWKFLISSHCSLHKFELFYYTETTQRCLWFECLALQKTSK